MPKSGSRIVIEKERVKQLVPYAVIFPYIRMGRSITGFVVDRSKGKFGPFEATFTILISADYVRGTKKRCCIGKHTTR